MQRPPVTLNNDLLLLIFNINADIFSNDGALATTRWSSQVCRAWRELILDSPSIWGGLFDLDALTQRKSDWRNEILRRSGKSPLSIRSLQALLSPSFVIIDGVALSTREIPLWQEFFFMLLEEHWSRIERLTVKVGSHISIPQDVLCSPAPHLRVFEVDLNSQVRFSRDLSIFANNAPLLHTFRSRSLAFNFTPAWINNLRYIEIGPGSSISFVLDVLKEATFLRSLVYAGRYDDGEDAQAISAYPSFRLGQGIQRVEMGTSFSSCMNLFRCIIPQTDYTLYISTSRANLNVSLENLSLYTERHYNVHVPTQISLNLSDQFYYSSRDGDGPQFSLRIPCPGGAESRGTLKILRALRIPVCNSVTELDLYVNHFLQAEDTSAITAFLRLFPSVKVLNIEDFMCAFLVNAQEQSSHILLPNLDTLRLDIGWENAVNFLNMREEIGHPISVLDLTKCAKSDYSMIPPESLQNFADLRVLWS